MPEWTSHMTSSSPTSTAQIHSGLKELDAMHSENMSINM